VLEERRRDEMQRTQADIERALDPAGRKRLLVYACRLLRGVAGDTAEEAKDLVMDAVSKVLTGDRRWDREKTPDPVDFLCSVVKSLASSRRKAEARRPPPRLSAEVAESVGALQPRQPNWDEAIDAERFVDDLIGECGDDKVCEKVVELIVFEGCEPAEIAERLGLPATDVYAARKRLKRKMEALRERQVKCMK